MTDASRDYSQTLFLPKTDFPMRAGLPQKEPEILARWEKLGLYQRLRNDARGRPKFILHEGCRAATSIGTRSTRSSRTW